MKLLVETGLLLAQERRLDVIVQTALDAGRQLTGASYGAFFYDTIGEDGERFQLYKLSGFEPDSMALLPKPWSTPFLQEVLRVSGGAAVRSADITLDPRYSQVEPFHGPPQGHPRVRSYLGVPVHGRGKDTVGTLIYGHPDLGIFTPELESLVTTVASQAAVAIENARLALSLNRQVRISDAAQQLQQVTDNRLRQALEAGGFGTFTWDRATDLLDLDERASELFHTTPNVSVSRSLLREQIVIPEDRAVTLQHLEDAVGTGSVYHAEYRVVAADGSVVWVSASGLPMAKGSEVTGMTGVVQDITARKMQEAALRQSEKLAATGRLAATIAHEINNPLEAVTNLIYLVKTDPELPPHLVQMMQTADSELARVGQIAQQTLGFYRDTTHPAEIDLSSLLSAVVNLFARKLEHKKLQYTMDLEPDLRLFGFAGEMRQIFSNLLVNAIDATSSGTIHLRARSRNLGGHAGVVVLLSDPGSGIPHHLRKRMFSPFFTTKQTVGTGLGLWVTRGMVEKHGGKIHFRSRTAHPTGTVFRVHLPRAIPGGSATYSSASETLIQ